MAGPRTDVDTGERRDRGGPRLRARRIVQASARGAAVAARGTAVSASRAPWQPAHAPLLWVERVGGGAVAEL